MTATYAIRPGQPYPVHTAAAAGPASAPAYSPGVQAPPAVHSLANFSTGPGLGPETTALNLPLAKRPLFTPKVVVWSMLGLVATAYIGTMLLAPALLDDLTPTSAYIAEPQSSQGQRTAARLVSDVNGLKESMAQVQLDLSKVKTEVATSADRANTMKTQLMALEQRLAQTSSETLDTAEPQMDANQSHRAVVAPKASPPAESDASAAGQTGSPQLPKLVNADAANNDATGERGLETGSVAQAAKAAAKAAKTASAKPKTADPAADPIDFANTTVQPATAAVGVQISSGASIDSLRLSWSLLADRHAATLKKLQPRYVARGDMDNPTYDLIAGPIKSKSDAERLCKALSAKNVPCAVSDYIGAAL
ncbi:MAG: SPOR domain-containing protein [Hyphomicrobium sp.]|nr:SPOR domain-containing protein [Hyphomicrobium sp.]